jgi:PPOX class probable F420-dependent enzyme
VPKGLLPETHLDLLEAPVLGHLATVDPLGHPQVNPVWFLYDGRHLLFSIRPETSKFRNLQANHWMALSVLDPDDPYRYLELRGRAIAFELYKTLTFVNLLAQKYTGADFTGGYPGQERYKITVEIVSWTAARN